MLLTLITFAEQQKSLEETVGAGWAFLLMLGIFALAGFLIWWFVIRKDK